ncbi:Short-chain dehydrogenase/reductase SDR [uncultured Paludibacter sp.]|nr:Short-chain dehydrogenase/reductase SDR [uncultured Paludibacter sp.]
MKTKQEAILLTGGSAGIGLATAKMLMDKGYRVYSGSRRGGGEALKSSISNGEIIPIKLDVNDEKTLNDAIKKIVEENGDLYAVISNAGNGIAGAVEDTSAEEAKYQLETNFFGAVKTIRACLPQFRKQKSGKIIAVTSVAGIIPIPFQAFYSAAKAAYQIYMEALAMEVKPFEIQCCTILPGDTKTDFTASRKYTEESQNENSPYYKQMKIAVGKMEKDEQNGMSPDVIAKAIVNQIERNKMKSRVIPGFQYKAICAISGWLPNSWRLKLINMVYS